MSLSSSPEITKSREATPDDSIAELIFDSSFLTELEQPPTRRIGRLGLATVATMATMVVGGAAMIGGSKLIESEGGQSTPSVYEQSLLRTAPRSTATAEATVLPSLHTTDQARPSKRSTHRHKRHHVHHRKPPAPAAPARPPAIRVVAAASHRSAPARQPVPPVRKSSPRPGPKPKAPAVDWKQSPYYSYGDDGPCYGDDGSRAYC